MEKVGIPRALSYYRYYPLWKTLIEEAGSKVVLSNPTGRRLLQEGALHCVDDICVPVKLYFGHVLDLAAKVDRILIQRIVSVEKHRLDTFTCPKMMGLPDMVRGSLEELPPLIEFTVDLKRRPLAHGACRLARSLGASPLRARKALRRALEAQARYEEALLAGSLPEEAMSHALSGNGNGVAERRTQEDDPCGLTIAVVGHEYMVHDPFISHDLPRKLADLGARVIYSSQVHPEVIRKELSGYPEISWSYEKVLLGASSHFMRRGDIHGVIMVIGFACGPDSIVSEIISREVRRDDSPPFMTLVIDEHTGEAGVVTRLEAFVDMVKRSKIK